MPVPAWPEISDGHRQESTAKPLLCGDRPGHNSQVSQDTEHCMDIGSAPLQRPQKPYSSAVKNVAALELLGHVNSPLSEDLSFCTTLAEHTSRCCLSCSCVAVCDKAGNVHILKDTTELGSSATVPSVIAFSQKEQRIFVGHDAVSQVMASRDAAHACWLSCSTGPLAGWPNMSQHGLHSCA